MTSEERFINWEVPKNWTIKHKAEINRAIKSTASLVGLLTLVGIAYQLGELNGRRNSEISSTTAAQATSEVDWRLAEASALVTTINENSSACGDAVVTEWRQGGIYADKGVNYENLIIFGDYPSAHITDSRIVIKSGDQSVASEPLSFASTFRVWFISDKSPNGDKVPAPECSKDSYTSGWYERDSEGNLELVTEQEMLCMTLLEGMITHFNYQDIENQCQSYWEK